MGNIEICCDRDICFIKSSRCYQARVFEKGSKTLLKYEIYCMTFVYLNSCARIQMHGFYFWQAVSHDP